MDRDALLRRQLVLLQQEATILTLMASLGMSLPPRGQVVPTAPEPEPKTTVGAPAHEQHACHCTGCMNRRSWRAPR